MHSHFHYAKTFESYNYDYSSDHAIWAISLVHYWCTHAFQVANCNGFYFNTYPLGLVPNGSLCLSMILYDPRTETYVIIMLLSAYGRMSISKFYTLFSPSCILFNPIFNTAMIAVFPHMFIICSMYMYMSCVTKTASFPCELT